MSSRTSDYRSFITSGYVDPILRLYDELERGPSNPPNDVQSSVWENGLSASIIALAILYLESLLNVSKYINGSQQPRVREYFKQTFPRSAHQDHVTELFAVRDVIAHNHVWEGQIDPVQMTWVSLQLSPGYGDAAFRRVVDMNTRLTKKLGLNVVPTRLWRGDIVTVIKTTAAILRELTQWHESQTPGRGLTRGAFGIGRYRSERISFLEFADRL